MTKLTKQQRLSVYMILLAEAEDPTFKGNGWNQKRVTVINGLCFMYSVIFNEDTLYKEAKTFPELAKIAGIHNISGGLQYLYNWDNRKRILRECINQLI